MIHPVQCRCGALKGELTRTQRELRCVCYCADCQAFANFLRHDNAVLDAAGGTEVIQTLPKQLRFTEGVEHLACMRLSANGLLRWYASCCNTPIGNTAANSKLSFVGLVHNCLESGGGSLDEAFGPVRTRVNPQSAKGDPKPKSAGLFAAIARVSVMLLKARLDGSYKQTPFFVPGSSTPIVTPRVLSLQERQQITTAA
jgi:hypothetical protein